MIETVLSHQAYGAGIYPTNRATTSLTSMGNKAGSSKSAGTPF
jgi:hypothetical protein